MLTFHHISGLFQRQKLFFGVDSAFSHQEPIEIEQENLVIYSSPEEDLSAALKTLQDNILKACKLDAGNSLNINQRLHPIRFGQLRGLKLKRILIFGNSAPFLSSSAGFTRLKPITFGDYRLICVPDLPDLANSQEAKTITWNALKDFYGIK